MNNESEFQEPSPPEISPHDDTVDDILFSLKKVKTQLYPAWELGNAICTLETAATNKNGEQLRREDYYGMIRAITEAAYVVLQHPSTARYTDDISLGLGAAIKLVQNWSKEEFKHTPAELTYEIRILRNALHNADLHLRLLELTQKERDKRTAQIIEDILAPIRHLITPRPNCTASNPPIERA